jgi:hypothetical protein
MPDYSDHYFVQLCDLAKCSLDFRYVTPGVGEVGAASWMASRIRRFHGACPSVLEIQAAIDAWDNRPPEITHNVGRIRL